MDHLSNKIHPVPAKVTRRQYSPESRAKIVNLTHQPNASVAVIALEHNLNANLVHKWRRNAAKQPSVQEQSDAFVSLPVQPIPAQATTVHFHLNGLVVDWPLAEIDHAIHLSI